MQDIKEIIKQKAKKSLKRILLIEGEDERIIEAAALAVKEKVAKPILIGNDAKIKAAAKKVKADLKGITIIDYKKFKNKEKFARKLYELRKHKGLTLPEAKKLLENPNYFGAMLLKMGYADGNVGGCKFSTAEHMRPALQVLGTKQGTKTVSGVFFIMAEDRTFVFSDSDINIIPDEGQLAEIAINANDCAKAVGFKPKVALLSHSTKGSGEHPSLESIRNALKIVKQKRPDIIIDGELQFDAAVNPFAAKQKCPDSVIKGDANVLIFPSIESANINLHALHQLAKNLTDFGSIIWGLSKPVTNGGRSWSYKEVFDAICVCAFQANL